MSVVDNIHILHIVSGDLWAGAEVQLYTLAKTQQLDHRTRVSVITLNPGRLELNLRDCGIDVTVVDESHYNGLQILVKLGNTIKDKRPDVVHTHRIKENILGSIAALLNGNVPSMRTAHGAAEHHPPWYHGRFHYPFPKGSHRH